MKLELIRLSEVVLADIVALHNDPRVTRHMPLARTAVDESHCRQWVQSKEAQWEENGYGPWGILIEGAFAGWGGLQLEMGDADLALVLAPKHWGAGPVIVAEIIRVAFEDMGLPSITALLPPGRTRVRGMRRLGFQPDGQVEISGCLFHRYRLFSPKRADRDAGPVP